MAEFVTVIKERKRMCESFDFCTNGCPLYDSTKSGSLCFGWISQHPEEAERTILKWAADNPEPDTIKDLDELKKLIRDDKITLHQLAKWIVEEYERTEEER